jgi:hypothetical protein
MTRLILLPVIFALVCSLCFAQTKPITVVRAEDNAPLAGIWVYDDAQLIVEQTDESGTFDIARFSDNQSIIFFHPDFVRRVLTKKEIERENFTIALEKISYTSDEVLVKGHRFGNDRAQIAQQVSEITAKQIEFDQPRTVAETLEEGGVYVQRSQYGGGSPMIRGYTANQVLLVLDGVRMNNAIYRAGNLQNSIQVDANALGLRRHSVRTRLRAVWQRCDGRRDGLQHIRSAAVADERQETRRQSFHALRYRQRRRNRRRNIAIRSAQVGVSRQCHLQRFRRSAFGPRPLRCLSRLWPPPRICLARKRSRCHRQK